jgi:hypothetical protein
MEDVRRDAAHGGPDDRSWLAPAIALGAMAVTFTLSTFVIAPLITASEGGGSQPGLQQPGGHESHHSK